MAPAVNLLPGAVKHAPVVRQHLIQRLGSSAESAEQIAPARRRRLQDTRSLRRQAASGDSRASAGPAASWRSRHRQTSRTVVRAEMQIEGLDRSDGVPLSEYGAALAAAAFGAVWNGYLHINSATLVQAFGWYSVAHVIACAVSESVDFDKVGVVVAPAMLAAYALNVAPVTNVAVGLLGFYLSRELEGPPWYLFAAALAASVYFGHGAMGFTAAYAYGTAVRLAHALEASTLPLISLPVLAISGFAAWQGHASLWVLCLALGELGRSAIALLQALANKNPRGFYDPERA